MNLPRVRSRALLGFACAVALSAIAADSPPASAASTPSPTAPAVSSTALEALQRLKGMDLEANPTLKDAVLRVVSGTRGTPVFVELVRDFRLTGQQEGLLEVAAGHPETTAGSDAIRLVLQEGGLETLRAALTQGDASRRAALLTAVAASGDPKAAPLLTERLLDPAATPSLRATAVRGLAATEAGAHDLLKVAADGKLDDTARTTASLALAQSRWPAIREQAARVLPPPTTGDGKALPPIAELVKKSGDVARGAAVFRGDQAACIKCHRVGTEGVDFGPALSLIGSKLGKQALYESILDPSAGIAFGFEGWSLETKGGEELFGILASETPEELAIRQQSGVVTRVKKADVTDRRKQALSIMPAGLAQLLTERDLVDLVEYLTTLKGPTGATPP